MSTTNVNDAEHFTKLISKGYSVTHFWAEWCAPCKDMDKFLEQLAQKHKNVNILRVSFFLFKNNC